MKKQLTSFNTTKNDEIYNTLRECRLTLVKLFDIQELLLCLSIQHLIAEKEDLRCVLCKDCYKIVQDVANAYSDLTWKIKLPKTPKYHNVQERLKHLFNFFGIKDSPERLNKKYPNIKATIQNPEYLNIVTVYRIHDYCKTFSQRRDLDEYTAKILICVFYYCGAIIRLYEKLNVLDPLYVIKTENGEVRLAFKKISGTVLAVYSLHGDIQVYQIC